MLFSFFFFLGTNRSTRCSAGSVRRAFGTGVCGCHYRGRPLERLAAAHARPLPAAPAALTCDIAGRSLLLLLLRRRRWLRLLLRRGWRLLHHHCGGAAAAAAATRLHRYLLRQHGHRGCHNPPAARRRGPGRAARSRQDSRSCARRLVPGLAVSVAVWGGRKE